MSGDGCRRGQGQREGKRGRDIDPEGERPADECADEHGAIKMLICGPWRQLAEDGQGSSDYGQGNTRRLQFQQLCLCRRWLASQNVT